jgi:predicted 3-demethylubiquinone-9 3-methyltransferase (glyoxalase superfamily)
MRLAEGQVRRIVASGSPRAARDVRKSGKSQKAMEAMLRMKKLDIDALKRAYGSV